MWEEYQSEGVIVLSIGAGETEEACKLWRYEYEQTCPVLSDPTNAVYAHYSLGGIPLNCVIDHNMVLQYLVAGFSETQVRNKLIDLSTPLVKIDFTPLTNTEQVSGAYQVNCNIRSGGTIIPGTSKIFWNTDGSGTYNVTPLTLVTGDNYAGAIPTQPVGSTVYYYLHAEADNGMVGNLPFNAPTDIFAFDVIADTQAPVINHTALTMWPAEDWGAPIEAEITDQLPLAAVWVEYSINGGSAATVFMSENADGLYTAQLGGSVSVGDTVNYRIYAGDTAQTAHATWEPASGYHSIAVIEKLDALVIDLDGNASSGNAINSELLTLGVNSQLQTDLPRYLNFYKSVWLCMGVFPDNYSLNFDQYIALYTYLMDENGYVYMEGGNVWCNDTRNPFQAEFSVGNDGKGEADTGPITGITATMTDGMYFEYTGDNMNMDRLKVKAGGTGIFQNVDPVYYSGIVKDNGYRTIGVSFEFGGLVDGSNPSTKHMLMWQYAGFFGLASAPTPTPTQEPTFTPTPTPTPTSGCSSLGVILAMPSDNFGPGDPCSCTVTVCNPGPQTYTGIPLFVILDVYGSYFFWPSFEEFDYRAIDLPVGESDTSVLPDFAWPTGVGTASGLNWYAGMTNAEMSDLLGEMDVFTFGWHE
jgi:hypothetical protein